MYPGNLKSPEGWAGVWFHLLTWVLLPVVTEEDIPDDLLSVHISKDSSKAKAFPSEPADLFTDPHLW